MTIDAIFLDRDGVINCERADYVKAWHEFEFLPGALSALSALAKLKKPILVISNQSAIGRGLMTKEIVQAIHQQALILIRAAGGRVDDFFICPHAPEADCTCRKPKPGLLRQAAQRYQLDLTRCVFVGDAISDYQAAQAVGCRSILVQSGRQAAQLPALQTSNPEVPIVKDLAAAAGLIQRSFYMQ
jgi:D-glycero-D-manno-heptose 1,7-bisphosphate phosphatase